MATSEQMVRGLQIMREVREDFPEMSPTGQRLLAHARWKAVEQQVARRRRRPR